jgi:hypothetical protein
MINDIIYWLSVLGSIASLVGLPIAIWQIRKTRRVAEAARDASDRTQKTISQNLLLSNIHTCIKNLEEIQSFVRYERYESAQIRAYDLISYLYQIQQRTKNSQQTLEIEYEEMLSELSIIREEFERKVNKSSARINNVQINTRLSEISDSLHKLVGGTIIAIEKGEENG